MRPRTPGKPGPQRPCPETPPPAPDRRTGRHQASPGAARAAGPAEIGPEALPQLRPRWTGRNHRPRPGDQPGPVEAPPTPSGPRKAHHAQSGTPGQTTGPRRKSSTTPSRAAHAAENRQAHIHLIYSKSAPAPVARISPAQLAKTPQADPPGRAPRSAPARTPGRNARTGSAAPAPAPLALPEISTRDSTGPRTPREETPRPEALRPAWRPCGRPAAQLPGEIGPKNSRFCYHPARGARKPQDGRKTAPI